ncbi:MAG TPA: hypothetical protein VLD37_00885 [Candidatus Bilamarchaeum sp.]|nr:hypothetical protein [Candidatus Bilamarchaeum sp.]
MEKNFRMPSEKSALTRREFLSAGALAAGLLVCGKALAGDGIPAAISELREKFRDMERYGITPAVCWSDPTMRKLLSGISTLNNSFARSGRTEALAVFGASPEEQYRALNSLLGRPRESPFGPDSLAALESRL